MSEASNIPEFSVSEISGAVKQTLESRFGRVRVRGEITELKRYPSGHVYLSLKDEGGKIAAVVWRGSVSRLGLAPENGVEVIATGKITAYGERSSYQLVIDRLEYAGAGALLARIEMLRARLAEEGLFEPSRKRALPMLPDLVGIVTSPQGAVLHDIRTTIARRFARDLLLWPVPVQGEGAAARIAAAIAGMDALPATGKLRRPDVLIVARGGGSLEDLMAFNDEAVLRAVAACSIPVISAVGHETDTTLIDHVSDRRAPTPTAAAELAVPMRVALAADLSHRAARLGHGLQRATQALRLRLSRAAAALPDLPHIVGMARQRLDDRNHRLSLALPALLAERRRQLVDRRHRLAVALPPVLARSRSRLLGVERRIASPHLAIAERRGAMTLAGASLAAAAQAPLRDAQLRLRLRQLPRAPLEALLRERRAILAGLAARLDSASYEAVLSRGYALVRDAQGHAVTHGAALRGGERLELTFADMARTVRVEPGPRGAAPPADQGALPLDP